MTKPQRTIDRKSLINAVAECRDSGEGYSIYVDTQDGALDVKSGTDRICDTEELLFTPTGLDDYQDGEGRVIGDDGYDIFGCAESIVRECIRWDTLFYSVEAV